MISIAAATFAYPHQPPVFERFTWSAAAGEVWAVLGPSACGKSTLLLLLAGLLHPQTGTVAVGGAPLQRPRPETGLILQEYGLLPWATLRANATLGLRMRRFYGPDGRHAPSGSRLDRAEIEAHAAYWLERLDIAEVAGRYPDEVSGGQRQRAAIARALVMQPDLLLMDEPFSALDAPTRESLQALALDLSAEAGLTVVLVTHSIEEAAFVGQKVLVLGAPPNRVARVVESPHAADSAYRASHAYQAMCARLRRELEGS
jgi:ABC-type nitrate/sulfonate/bicarbonate transport system ATPase subunit